MAWFKKKQEPEIKEVKKPPTLAEILDNPWYIDNADRGENRIWFEIKVFRFDKSYTDGLACCSKIIVGISYEELVRMCKEVFGHKNIESYSFGGNANHLYFKNKEDAFKIIEEFRPYYDSYHIPRVVADRLTNYDEANGGYPAPMYLKEKAGTQGDAYQIKLVK